MNMKFLATMGMIFSIAIAIVGVVVLCGGLGGDAGYPSGALSYYDSGYASFGGDFYTYVNNNAAEAADAGNRAAANVKELCDLVKNVSGAFLIGFGLLGMCLFGIVRCNSIDGNMEEELHRIFEAECAGDEDDASTKMPAAPEIPEVPAAEVEI